MKFRGREGGGRVGPNVFADVEFSGKTMDGGNLALGERFAVLTSSEPWKNDTERTYFCLKIAAYTCARNPALPKQFGSLRLDFAALSAREDTSPAKIDVTSKSTVGDISVVTLIRTDTTLDHSQKAEKV